MEQISKILDVIHRQAQEEADEIMQNSTQRIIEIQHTYANEARIGGQAILNTAMRQADEIHKRSESQADMESRGIQLSAKRKILERVFAEVQKKLADSEPEVRKAFYEKLIEKYSLGNEVTVQMNDDDRRTLGKKLKVKGIELSIDKIPGDFCGGLIIKEQRVQTDCTFEALVADMQKALEPEVAGMVFMQNE